MTMKAKIFRICLALEYLAFVGLIVGGIYQSDAFNSRLLVPITLLGIACAINTWGMLDKPGGTREGDSPKGKMPLRRSSMPGGSPTRDARNNR